MSEMYINLYLQPSSGRPPELLFEWFPGLNRKWVSE